MHERPACNWEPTTSARMGEGLLRSSLTTDSRGCFKTVSLQTAGGTAKWSHAGGASRDGVNLLIPHLNDRQVQKGQGRHKGRKSRCQAWLLIGPTGPPATARCLNPTCGSSCSRRKPEPARYTSPRLPHT
eukprot:364522-Chlamydomonas_euryale.AAC.20